MTYRITKYAVLLGMLLSMLVFTTSASAAVGTWTSRASQSTFTGVSDPIVVSLTYDGGYGSYDGGQTNPPDCLSVPCTVTGRVVANNTGKTIASVTWSKDFGPSTYAGSGPDWAATWSYVASGSDNPDMTAHLSDGSTAGPNIGQIQVVNGAEPVPAVSCACPGTLYPADNRRNTFVVSANTPNMDVQLYRNDGEVATYYPERTWQDGAGYHQLFRVTTFVQDGRLQIAYSATNTRGTTSQTAYVMVAGPIPPPPPRFTNVVEVPFGVKKRGLCAYGAILSATALTESKPQLALRLERRRGRGPWQLLKKSITVKKWVAAGRWTIWGGLVFSPRARSFRDNHTTYRLVVLPTIQADITTTYHLKAQHASISRKHLQSCSFDDRKPKVTRVSKLS